MKKWEKIENSINQLILKLISLFKSKISNLTPSKFKGYVKESKELLTHRRGELKERLVKGKEHALKKAVNAKGKIDQAKNKTLTVVQKAKTTNYKEIKLRKVFAILIAFIAPPFMKFKQWYLGLRPGQLATYIVGTTAATLASINLYVQSNKISEKSREPASEAAEEVNNGTEASRRPAYFKKKEKQFLVSNIALPAYTTKKSAVRKLVIDFTFESSNKYIKEYLWHNNHLIQDVLNSKIEPIAIEFPLKQEGKIIIRQKIKKEINSLLKTLKIKGEIKEVYIHSIIAG